MNLLIADDSEYILQNLSKLLRTVSKVENIYLARNVQEAIVMLEAHQPDVIVLDIKMPNGIGFDVLAAARKRSPQPLVIMLTNYNLEQYRQRSISEGADYFFDKSSEFEKVIDVIENLDTK